MKIRQARKIMRQQPENDLPHHKCSAYWDWQWVLYNFSVSPFRNFKGRRDHRIDKAIRLSQKAEMRDYQHFADKFLAKVNRISKRSPITVNGLTEFIKKTKSYGCQSAQGAIP